MIDRVSSRKTDRELGTVAVVPQEMPQTAAAAAASWLCCTYHPQRGHVPSSMERNGEAKPTLWACGLSGGLPAGIKEGNPHH